ncbi:hypothetical protein VTN77DRAFT_4508 [Rasamsonia byssochlamydoides]|uniref:uncharacterized protein n=1 Tax=Rasamsonia byssochlamydoides TaxID=89139 RepID=UPI003742F035
MASSTTPSTDPATDEPIPPAITPNGQLSRLEDVLKMAEKLNNAFAGDDLESAMALGLIIESYIGFVSSVISLGDKK